VVIGKAQMKGVPIISVADDTFTTIDRIEATIGRTRIREKAKLDRAKEIMDIEFDLQRFLKAAARRS
jgi:BioD-like phosphotransacetylase family protein